MLAWTLFALGGVYAWSLVPSLVALSVITALRRPALGQEWLAIDAALAVTFVAAGLQIVPLPDALRAALSPASADFQQRIAIVAAGAPRTLSLAPGAWLWGIGTLAGALLCFWATRQIAQNRGARFIPRMVAWMGLASALLVVVEPAMFPDGKMYGFWQPVSPMAHPAGPIVSRNHYAAWLLLALPLTAGYLGAHVRTHWGGRRRRVQLLADARATWLASAAVLMTVAMFVTQSRAGILGLGAAVACGLGLGWRHSGAAGRIAMVLFVALLVSGVFAWARPDKVLTRFDHAIATEGWGGREEIWRESAAIGRRYWRTGIGLGTFDVVMPAYQTVPLTALINHAHNQYLHTFVEGGVLVTLPVSAVMVTFMLAAGRRLREDHTPMIHVRQGALAGIAGLAVQSIWETPLLTPAVLFLLAAAAGLAVHRPPRLHHPEEAAA